MTGAAQTLKQIPLDPRSGFIHAISKITENFSHLVEVPMIANSPELDRLTSAVLKAASDMDKAMKEFLKAGGVEVLPPERH